MPHSMRGAVWGHGVTTPKEVGLRDGGSEDHHRTVWIGDDLERRIAQLEARSEALLRRCAEFAWRDREAEARREQRRQFLQQVWFLERQPLWEDDDGRGQ